MHLIVPCEFGPGVAPAAPAVADLDALWAPVLQALQPSWRIELPAESLSTAGEWALARLVLGELPGPHDDGRLPWAAWKRGEAGPWARLTPFHGLVGSDRITGLPPQALALGDDESREMFQSLVPLFESEGVRLEWRSALEWQISHESLRDLPCASLQRMVGDSLQRWQGVTPLREARLLRRLQNEAQMVLHDHPINRQREARRALVVNSLWLSEAGAGDRPGCAASPGDMAQRLRSVQVLDALEVEPVVQWLQARQAQTEGPTPLLVLCGADRAQAFALRASPPERQPGWARLRAAFLAAAFKRTEPVRGIAHWRAELNRCESDDPVKADRPLERR